MNPEKNQLFTHYKGGQFKIIDVAYEESTTQKVVVYQALYDTDDLGDKPIFTRLLSSWNETVSFEGEKVLRFSPVDFPELQFVTGNQKKIIEARSIIPNLKQLSIDLAEIQSLDPKVIIVAKIEEAKKHGYKNFFVEDTSLFVDSVGYPGPLIKWVLNTIGLDFGLYYKDETARVICSIGYCDSEGKTQFVEGIVKGKMVEARGTYFGFDPIFQPDGFEQTFAEMTLEEKAKISHRTLALQKLQKIL